MIDLQNAFVVLQNPQEDAHQSISFDVLVRALGKEDVCFIEKHYTVPRLCELKRGVQCRLNFFGFESKVTTGDGQKRLAIRCSDAFRSRSLANTRHTMEEYDYTFALFSNKVELGVFVPVFREVSADEGLDDAFMAIGDFKVFPRVFRSIDVGKTISTRAIEAQSQTCSRVCQLMSPGAVVICENLPQRRVRKMNANTLSGKSRTSSPSGIASPLDHFCCLICSFLERLSRDLASQASSLSADSMPSVSSAISVSQQTATSSTGPKPGFACIPRSKSITTWLSTRSVNSR